MCIYAYKIQFFDNKKKQQNKTKYKQDANACTLFTQRRPTGIEINENIDGMNDFVTL